MLQQRSETCAMSALMAGVLVCLGGTFLGVAVHAEHVRPPSPPESLVAATAVKALLPSHQRYDVPGGESGETPKSHWGGALPSQVVAFNYESLPGRLASPELRELWISGLTHESRDELAQSIVSYEVIVDRVPEEPFTYWRIARNYWRIGEDYPTENKSARLARFSLARDWADRGLQASPNCAPCMLWKFVAMGRQATTRGLMSAVSDAREMSRLIRRGIELQPQHRDGPGNSTLGNLYYAGAVFYRIMPDWWWLRFLIGVRGDRALAVEYAREAVRSSSVRIDYRVELGASLLCLGVAEGEPAAVEEGLVALRETSGMKDYMSTDRYDKAHALQLMAQPAKACGYSRDGFIDVDSLRTESRNHH